MQPVSAVEVVGVLVDVVVVAALDDAHQGGPRVHPFSDCECRPPAALVQQLSHLGFSSHGREALTLNPSGRPTYVPPEAAGSERDQGETIPPWLV